MCLNTCINVLAQNVHISDYNIIFHFTARSQVVIMIEFIRKLLFIKKVFNLFKCNICISIFGDPEKKIERFAPLLNSPSPAK